MLDVIKEADAVVITAGAGMGVDSELPDFRGDEGLWKAYPLLGKRKISFSSIANPKTFIKNPKLAWAFYGHRYDLYKKTRPHQGFHKLLELCQTKDYFVVTSNIDGHFQKAGFDKNKIYEIHGRLYKFQCIAGCCQPFVPEIDEFQVDPETLTMKSDLPKCPHCGSLARPNILMFNDYEFQSKETLEQAKRFDEFMHQYDKGDKKIVIIEIGAGTAIPSIRIIGEHIHENVKKATLIRINPKEAQGPSGIISIKKTAVEALDEIL